MRFYFPVFLLAATLVATLSQVALYADRLPDPMASHFDSAGFADGWMSKPAFLALMVGLQFGLAALLVCMGWLASKLPPSMINIPHREYWLSGDRMAETLAYNRQMMHWLAALTALLILVIFQLNIQANLTETRALPTRTVWIVISLYLIAVVWCAGCLIRRFSRIPV